MYGNIPKFKKIELLVKSETSISTNKITHENAGLAIQGNYLVIEEETGTTTTGKVYNLSEIHMYKTYNK